MEYTNFNLDLYNNNISIIRNGAAHLFSSVEYFIQNTNFPFVNQARIVHYEPDRNIFVVERSGPEIVSGADLVEIVWITDNIETIWQLAITDKAEQDARNAPSANMLRAVKLYETDWILQRHQEETLLNLPHKFTDQQMTDILTYRQALRDLGGINTANTPADQVNWPSVPDFIG